MLARHYTLIVIVLTSLWENGKNSVWGYQQKLYRAWNHVQNLRLRLLTKLDWVYQVLYNKCDVDLCKQILKTFVSGSPIYGFTFRVLIYEFCAKAAWICRRFPYLYEIDGACRYLKRSQIEVSHTDPQMKLSFRLFFFKIAYKLISYMVNHFTINL